jgi:recombination protein RecT
MTTTDNHSPSVTAAVATRDNTPAGLVRQYSADFTQVMPSHLKPEAWVRIAVGALKKGRKQGDRYELEIAASNNPGVFLAALLDAARLGLEPGTEQYYLTPRKVKGQLEILGIVGYQGIVELIYRAGAVSSVVAEVVYTNDRFEYRPGLDDFPKHEIDWDSEDRGELRLVYAYARMKDGATSKVVVLNKAAIKAIKASSQGAESEYSPWQKHPASMWLKSAVRQLAKWVPTSAEYVLHAERAKAAREETALPAGPGVEGITDGANVHRSTGEVLDAELVADVDVLWEEIGTVTSDMPADFDVEQDFPRWAEGTPTDAATPEQLTDYLADLRGRAQS